MSLVVQIALLLSAWIGHFWWQVEALNHFLGWPTPKWFSKMVRKTNTVFIFLGAVLLFFAAFDPLSWITDTYIGSILIVYYWFCVFFGIVIFPVLQFRYWFRQKPACLVEQQINEKDIAAELGFIPYGHGKKITYAHFPYNEIFRVDFSTKYLRIPSLPRTLDGLKILHITDLHFCGIPDRQYYEKVIELCQGWDCDILAVTGDIVDSPDHQRWIIPILGKLRFREKGYAILGNHDQWYEPERIRRRVRKIGLTLLGNSVAIDEVRGEKVAMIGHEGPWFMPGPNVSQIPKDCFRIVLSHTPDNISWAVRENMPLVLAGHNHGGQIRVPGIGSIFVPSKYSRRYDCGIFQEKNTVLHVSRGLAGQYPLRWFCLPEVTQLVLLCSDSDVP